MKFDPEDPEMNIGAPTETRWDELPLWTKVHCRSDNPPTSVEAAAKAEYTSAAQRAVILNTIRVYGPCNADRVDELCGFPMGTAGRRLHEMLDVLENTHQEAPTRRGGKGEVWRVKQPKGEAA